MPNEHFFFIYITVWTSGIR